MEHGDPRPDRGHLDDRPTAPDLGDWRVDARPGVTTDGGPLVCTISASQEISRYVRTHRSGLPAPRATLTVAPAGAPNGSNGLLGHAYGRSMRYRELMATGRGPAGAAKAAAIAAGLGGLVGAFALPGTRQLLDRVLPDPGEGPSEVAREKGFFHIDVHTRTSTGARLVCEIRAPGDPGYKATAVMFGESALALALDEDRLPGAAGVLTPATALGHVLAERLRAAGHRYDVVSR